MVEAAWIDRLSEGARPAFVCDITMGLLTAARARRPGSRRCLVISATPGSRHCGVCRCPTSRARRSGSRCIAILRATPRVRVVLDFLAAQMKKDRRLLLGEGAEAFVQNVPDSEDHRPARYGATSRSAPVALVAATAHQTAPAIAAAPPTTSSAIPVSRNVWHASCSKADPRAGLAVGAAIADW